MSKEQGIDFVLPWVDGSDPEWIASFDQYKGEAAGEITDTQKGRYRDYGLLRYWFRGVEKFAPWVRKVHFITCGQKPIWLNLNHPKLNFVRHSDYMPQSALPTFSSHPIEINMHKIPGLSERFVYFNDDFFLTADVKTSFFFAKHKRGGGIPCDCASPIIQSASANVGLVMLGIVQNDLACIERNFNKKEVMRKNFFKWFNIKYGWRSLIRVAYLFHLPHFTGFLDPHMPQPFLKSSIEDAWLHNSEILDKTTHAKFRSAYDVNQWVFRYWQLCTGQFSPAKPYKGKVYFGLADPIEKICGAIKDPKIKVVVINDPGDGDFDEPINKLRETFEEILPEKSSFELD